MYFKGLNVGELYEIDFFKESTTFSFHKAYSCGFLNLKEPRLLLSENWIKNTVPRPDAVKCLGELYLFGVGYRSSNRHSWSIDADTWPGYLDGVLAHPHHLEKLRTAQDFHEIQEVDEVFHVFHPHVSLFGHFLIESLYKLLMLEELAKSGCLIPVYVSSESPGFILDYISLACPNVPTIKVDAGVVIRARRVYDFVFHENYVWPHNTVGLVRKFARRFAVEYGGRKLFVSRNGLQSLTNFRELTNSQDLENIVLELGYEVVSPETLSLEQQLAVFSSASVIVGEYGSGIHNAMFAKPGTKVLCLNYVNLVQQAIGYSFGHELVFLMGKSGVSTKAQLKRSSPDKYEVDLELFKSALEVI